MRQIDSKWLQYDPRNTAGQCRGCNGPGKGRQADFAAAIDARDGVGTAAALVREAKEKKWWQPKAADLKEKLDELKQLRKDMGA